MPIESWLGALAQTDHSAVDGDLEALAQKEYPFLLDQDVSNQIECLSGHLGARHSMVRRLVISYSLYIRQVDTILQAGARAICRTQCPRPPVGCCTREHFVIMNMADLMSSHNSPLALHMAHTIGQLQKLESKHNMADRKPSLRPGNCTLLAQDGCTLRLFKSPRCAHYMCQEMETVLQRETAGKAGGFLSAMKHAESCTISCPADYTSAEVIAQAVLLYGDTSAEA